MYINDNRTDINQAIRSNEDRRKKYTYISTESPPFTDSDGVEVQWERRTWFDRRVKKCIGC